MSGTKWTADGPGHRIGGRHRYRLQPKTRLVALRKSLGDLCTIHVSSTPEGGLITGTPRPSETVFVPEADI
jgi:hypothetical protein